MRDEIVVRVQREASLFWPILLILTAFMYWKWVLLIIGAVAAAFLIYWLVKSVRQDMHEQAAMEAFAAEQARKERARLRHNATVEDQLVYRGDPAGTYGLDFTDGKVSGH